MVYTIDCPNCGKGFKSLYKEQVQAQYNIHHIYKHKGEKKQASVTEEKENEQEINNTEETNNTEE